MRRAPTALALAVLAAVLAGCAQEGVTLTAAGAVGATGASATAGEGFNPYAGSTGTPGGREVIQNPTLAEVMQSGPLPEMALGRADAPVTIVKYASLTCPHCRRFHLEVFPELERTYIATGKVRFILREFPIGQSSGNATIALRCAPPDKYFDLYGKFLAQQSSWVSQEVRLDAIFNVARQVGMTRGQFDACLQNQGMIEGLKWVKERGRKLGIIGTPNFFFGDKLVKSTVTMKEIREFVETGHVSGARPAAAAEAAR